MFKIAPRYDEKDILDTTSTIDAAIVSVKKLSLKDGRTLVVRDGARIRVTARAGFAWWMKPCPKKCSGGMVVGGPYGTLVPCSVPSCVGGIVEDLPCQ